MFIDAEREWCEAPVVAGKAKLAAQQIRALREAASRGEPLTDKEQVIKEGVDELLHNSTGAADTVVPLARTAPHDVVRRLMAEWTSHKIRGVNTDKTWQEYVERKLNELGYSVEKETT